MTATDDEIRAAAEKVANACRWELFTENKGGVSHWKLPGGIPVFPDSMNDLFEFVVPIAREKWGVKEIAFRSPDEVIVVAQLLLPPGYPWRYYANHESPATALLLALAQVAPEEVGE